jgi:hypothetical protein
VGMVDGPRAGLAALEAIEGMEGTIASRRCARTCWRWRATGPLPTTPTGVPRG